MRRLQALRVDVIQATLAQAVARSAEARYVHRLHTVLLVGHGRSCLEVAHWFGDNPRSVERWIHAYEVGGPVELRDHHHAGRPPRLTLAQLQQLDSELAAAPGGCGYAQARWSGKLVARHIAERFAVTLSARQCQRLLRRSCGART